MKRFEVYGLTTQPRRTTALRGNNAAYIALEAENPDGISHVETELVLYARIEDFSAILACPIVEAQAQWEIKIPKSEQNLTGGRIRIRATEVLSGSGTSGEHTYVQTCKIPNANGGESEIATPSSEDAYIAFSKLAGRGMRKKRFIFPIAGTDMKWEIDVPIKEESSNGLHNWCKIDLEYKEKLPDPLPPLPEGLVDIIYNQNGRRTPEEEKIVRSIYDAFAIAAQ